MDLQTLHQRTGIDKRKLRYCLDHGLVPGVESSPREVGRARKFHDDVGFAIVCAAQLLELGLRHEMIRQFLTGLMKITLPKYPKESVLASILSRELPAVVHLGDGDNIRLEVTDPAWDSGWRQLEDLRPAKGHEPLVVVTLNLGEIYRRVLGKNS